MFMRSKILIAVLTLVCTLGFGLPAGAITVDTNAGGNTCLGIVDFVLLAERTIQMEGGPVQINGNIGVNQPKSVTGLNESIHVGQFNQINGTALGDRIFSGNSASHIDVVEAKVLTGLGDVGTVNVPTTCSFPFIADLGVLTGVTGLDFSCLTGVNLGAVTVADNGTAGPLAPGCYTDVNVGDNATLTLAAGNFTFNTVTTGIGSTLASAGTSNLAVKGLFRSGAGSTVSGLLIRVAATTGEVQIGNSSTFDSTIFAPFTTVHIRGGATYSGEIVGKKIIVEPSKNVPPPNVGCGCFDTVTKAAGGATTTLTGGINLLEATAFLLKNDCNPAGGIAVTAVTPPPAATDQTVVLNTAGKAGGPFHVIAVFPSGTYCSGDTITLP
jgi:hypothetical protein